jgi:hypothetical protein
MALWWFLLTAFLSNHFFGGYVSEIIRERYENKRSEHRWY